MRGLYIWREKWSLYIINKGSECEKAGSNRVYTFGRSRFIHKSREVGSHDIFVIAGILIEHKNCL